jgi:hypothetical protein
MARASFVARFFGVVLVLTLPVACGGSSSPSSARAAHVSAVASPSEASLPAGLVAGSYYVFDHPHAPGVQGDSDGLLFADSAHASIQGVRFSLRGTMHEQLSIVGDRMTFSHSLPDGQDCHSSEVGVYRFTVAGNVLRLYAVKDTCPQREEILVGHDLTMPSSKVALPSAAGLPAGLVAGSYYVYVLPHAPATVSSSDAVLFVDPTRAYVRGEIQGLRATEHDQLSIAGDEMTFSHALPGGEPCDTSDVGVYRFAVTGRVVRFQAVKDTCPQRQAILVGHDLTLPAS